MTHILICDDEADLRETIGDYLKRRGYDVSFAADGDALKVVLGCDDTVDLILLDITMPGDDGLTVLRALRTGHEVPVIMVTAAGETVDRIVGLELGADDYLAKPVDLRELDARIKAVLRRDRPTKKAAPLQPAATEHAFDGLRFIPEAGKLFGRDGEEIALTAMELRLLEAFVNARGRVLNRDQLLDLAHDRNRDPFDRSIDIRVSRLRRKIERDPQQPVLIRTARGIGYIFDPPKTS